MKRRPVSWLRKLWSCCRRNEGDSNQVELPECCILSEYGHFLLYYKGAFYDNMKGIFTEYDYTQLVAYLEINLVEGA